MALDKLQFDRTEAAPGTFSTDMLNRIEEWTAFLTDKLRGYGYWANITPRNVERPQAEEPLNPALWYQSDIPTRGEIDRIRRNVDALQTGFARLPDWREILYNNTVDFGQANALEWDLQRIYDWMNAMATAFLTRQANTIFMQAGGIFNA